MYPEKSVLRAARYRLVTQGNVSRDHGSILAAIDARSLYESLYPTFRPV